MYYLLTAVYFEQGNYDQCIKECEEAVEVGREHRADFKLIAKLVPILDAFVEITALYPCVLLSEA